MTDVDRRALAEAFDELVDLEPEARVARLAGLAREAPSLAAELERLLAADAVADAPLDRPVGESAGELVRDWLECDTDRAGEHVGPYRLTHLLGRGGMGEVWAAERTDGGFEQSVAIKLLQRGMDTDGVLRRFRRERQILARLAHPGIARLLDGGVTGDGRPYFVLERVDGKPITVHAREHGLGVRERAALVLAACDAVDAAHRSLVVHRDLKPSNVLVTASGELKLLDFGIAKWLEGEGEEGVETRLGERALTPAFAAPEQILGEPATTAVDVYALGVLLGVLLTGRLPHERRTGAGATLSADAEGELAPRLSTLARRAAPEALDELALPARDRAQLPRALRGDLDTIAARCLERDPARRYASAAALADDLRRFLDGRPILARPHSGLERAKRFVVRHRLAATAALLVLLSLVSGLAVALWQARRAGRAAIESAANARRAERTRDFLVSLFAVADPLQSGGRSVTAGELLDQGAKRLETELTGEPEVRADLFEAVARVQTSLGLLEAAESSARRAAALRAVDDTVARARTDATIGAIRLQQGNLDDAESRLTGALAVLDSAAPGDVPPLVLARARSDAAQVLFWRKRSEEALAIERQVLQVFEQELGPEHVETALHRRNVGVILDDRGELAEAERAVRAAQATLERAFGPDHPNVAQGYLDLGSIRFKQDARAETEALVRRTIEIRRRTLGDRHVQTAQAHQNLAHYLAEWGRFAESEVATGEALAIFRSINPASFEVGKCLNTLGNVAVDRGDAAAGEPLLREALANFDVSLGRDHPFYWWTSGTLASTLAALGRFEESEALHRQVISELERVSGAGSADVQWAHELLAKTLTRQGRVDEAERSAARAREIAAALAKAG